MLALKVKGQSLGQIDYTFHELTETTKLHLPVKLSVAVSSYLIQKTRR